MMADQEPFVMERTFNSPIETIWKALTQPEQMRQWYFDIPDFKPVVGCEFSFTGENEGRKFIHLCKITEVGPQKKLSHSWRYKDEKGNSLVTFELFNEGEKTKLRLTHEGLETFPNVKDFAKENFVMGWTQIIGINLAHYLERISAK